MATNTGVIDLVKPAGNENALISVINSNMDKIDAEAGRARANVAANYSSTSAYAVGDLCIYQGSLYRCNTAIGSGGENWTAGHWTQVNIAGELATLNDQIGTLNSNLPMNQEFLNSEVIVGKYNGITLYERYYAGSVSNIAVDTNLILITGLPLPNKIITLSITFNINNNSLIETPDRYIRAYVNDSGELVVNQSLGNLSRIVGYARVIYTH